jgi:hypothetical protein
MEKKKMKTRFLIILGVIITFVIAFFVLGPSQGHIAEYFLTNEQFEDMILGDAPHMSDSRNTGNPTECWYQEDNGEMLPCMIDVDNSIDGFAIDDAQGNVKHYPISELDQIPCHEFMSFWNNDFRTVAEHEILIAKYDTCFDETFGGPGNRHPAFSGWDIPKICTQDMIKYFKKYSSMFDVNEGYASPLDGDTGIDIDPADFVQCENELLSIREDRK